MVGTDYGSINRLDRASGQFTRYEADPQDSQRLGGGQVMSIYQDADGIVWVGTYGTGLPRWLSKSNLLFGDQFGFGVWVSWLWLLWWRGYIGYDRRALSVSG